MKSNLLNIRGIVVMLLLSVLSLSAYAQGTNNTKKEELSKKELKEYTGEYLFDNKSERGFDVVVSLENGKDLMAQPTDKSQPLTSLIAIGKDHFELARTNGLEMVFVRDKKGKIISLELFRGDQGFTAIKNK